MEILFPVAVIIALGLWSIGRGLREVASAIRYKGHVQVDISGILDEFRRWMRVHYYKEKP